jgi:hypothetical protein
MQNFPPLLICGAAALLSSQTNTFGIVIVLLNISSETESKKFRSPVSSKEYTTVTPTTNYMKYSKEIHIHTLPTISLKCRFVDLDGEENSKNSNN